MSRIKPAGGGEANENGGITQDVVCIQCNRLTFLTLRREQQPYNPWAETLEERTLRINRIKAEYYLIFAFCLVKLVLHLIADANSGFQGDELLYIESGHHRDFGYMEFSPLIGWIAYVQDLTSSHSVFTHHISVHLVATLLLVIAASIVIQLGGESKAVFIFLLCILVAPAFGRSQQLFQPVVFSQLFWLLGFYQLIRFTKTGDKAYLLYLAIVLAFGFLTKYDILFFIGGLLSLFFFERTRTVIFTRSFLMYSLFFLLLISPNIWWQYRHGFPFLMHFLELYASQLKPIGWTSTVIDLLVSLNPLTAIIWIAGFLFMFNSTEKQTYRPIAAAILLSVSLLAIARGKFYYFFPLKVMALAFGSIWFERTLLSKRRWLLYPTVIIFLLSGIVMVPHTLPLMPVNDFIKFARIEREDGRYKIPFQEYYSRSLWHNTLSAIQKTYDGLPKIERQKCLIWGKHYKEAGAVNLYRDEYHLPKAFSYHGSFYLWAPAGKIPNTIIAVSDRGAGMDFWRTYFDTVVEKERVYDPYANDDDDLWRTIYICSNPKQDFNDLKEVFRNRIFE